VGGLSQQTQRPLGGIGSTTAFLITPLLPLSGDVGPAVTSRANDSSVKPETTQTVDETAGTAESIIIGGLINATEGPVRNAAESGSRLRYWAPEQAVTI